MAAAVFLFGTQFIHLFIIKWIEIDAMHQIYEPIRGIIGGHIIDLLQQDEQQFGKLFVIVLDLLGEGVCGLQGCLRLQFTHMQRSQKKKTKKD